MTETRTYPSSAASAGQARRFVESVLTGAGLDHLAYAATMLVSELVANAVLHTGTPLRVVVHPGDDRVRVEVHDGSRQLPVRRHYSNMSGTGRGLLLVERMAADWGADADQGRQGGVVRARRLGRADLRHPRCGGALTSG